MITSFKQRPYRFLSNFHGCEVYMDGEVYPSLEHAYQAAKTFDPVERRMVKRQPTAAKAKAAGKKVTLRPRWDQIKTGIMHRLLESKFEEPHLRRKLLATWPKPLVHGNDHHDKFWGICKFTGEGKNVLGLLLMQVREDIREGRIRPIQNRHARRYFRKRAWDDQQRQHQTTWKELPKWPKMRKAGFRWELDKKIRGPK